MMGGATPFAWASLASGVLGGAAQVANGTPAGPSSADSMFGSVLSNFDSSGWMVNFGDGVEQVSENAHAAPTLTPAQSVAATLPGLGSITAYMPYIVLFVGAALLIKVWKQ